MSRSQRSRKEKDGVFINYLNGSNKQDKQIANKKFRRKSKLNIRDLDKDIPYDLDEVSDTWNFRSDGLAHYTSFSFKNNYFNNMVDKEEWEEILKKLKRK